MALSPPFPSKPTPITLVSDFRLDQKLEHLKKDRRFASMRVAVMDLALSSTAAGGGGGLNLFSGWNVHQTRYSASVVKVAAMFAAFQLRKNINDAANIPAKDQADLFKQIQAGWQPIVERAVKGPKNFPKLATIFDASGSGNTWTCDFKADYRQAIEDMIGPSDNKAAATCITALGHQYINGALAAEELYTPKLGGLWLGANYAGTNWQVEPKEKSSYIAASPWALARFLTMLQTDRLVSPGASGEMRTMMNNFYQQRILRSVSRPFSHEFGKLGIGHAGGYFDAGVVERGTVPGGTAGPRRIRYGAVMLNAQSVSPIMRDLGVGIDDVMLAWRP